MFSYNESSTQQQLTTGIKLNKRIGFPSAGAPPPPLPGNCPPPSRLHDAGARPPTDSLMPPPPAILVPPPASASVSLTSSPPQSSSSRFGVYFSNLKGVRVSIKKGYRENLNRF